MTRSRGSRELRLALAAGMVLTAAVGNGCKEDPGTSVTDLLEVSGVQPVAGPLAGGTRVTITGAAFTDITSVTIAGVALEHVAVVSPTQITGTTPPGVRNGFQDVDVVSSSSGNGRCGGCFQYTQFPGSLLLRLASSPADSSQGAGALLVGITGGPVSSIVPGGARVLWATAAATPAHLIVTGSLAAGMHLVTIELPDTQLGARERYRASVLQAAGSPLTGYHRVPVTGFQVSLEAAGSAH